MISFYLEDDDGTWSPDDEFPIGDGAPQFETREAALNAARLASLGSSDVIRVYRAGELVALAQGGQVFAPVAPSAWHEMSTAERAGR